MANFRNCSVPMLFMLLAGCSVGPDFTRPGVPSLPQSFTHQRAGQAAPSRDACPHSTV